MTRVLARLIALVVAACCPVALVHAGGGEGRELDRGWWRDMDGAAGCWHCRLEAMGAAGKSRAGHFDDVSGRSLLNYPPARVVDYRHMRLDVVIPDMNTPRLEAACTYTLVPLGKPVERLLLNAGTTRSMQVNDVAVEGGAEGGAAATFTHDDAGLAIRFEPALPVGVEQRVRIVYTLVDPPEGLTWTLESPAFPGRPAQLHTQGQPESNRYWFPCHDFPNERMTTEVVVSVPRGYLASSNGKLVSKEATREESLPPSLRRSLTGSRAHETFHWLQDKSHVPYLVTLVVGVFDVVDVTTGDLPMPVYAPVGKGGQVKQTYGRTPEMIRLFERLTGHAYPWDRYAQLIVHNFGAGGMENTSATTMFDTAILDRPALLDGDLDGLIAHELAHQWFGDLLTCNSWEHIWLNEGFATYFSNLWFEERDGFDAYQAGVFGNMRGIAANDRADAPFQPAMVSKEYAHPWETFRRAANPYPKGAAVLHMLRMKLGDEAFFRALGAYVNRNADRTVETSDFRKALEEVSGLGLERFFKQWCERPGVPHLKVTSAWDETTGQLTITMEQMQTIDGYNPAFEVEVPFYVAVPGVKEPLVPRIRTDMRMASVTVPAAAAPEFIAVDPGMWVLADYEQEQPAAAWLAQVERGPTLAARMRAIDAVADLSGADRTAGAAALATLARDDRAHHSLRIAAVEGLGRLEAREELVALAGGAGGRGNWPDDARVRRAVVDQLGTVGRGEKGSPANTAIVAMLTDRARRDASYGVRASAVRALGSIKAPESVAVALDALRTESQHDEIRQAGLDALAALDVPEGLEAAAASTRLGVYSRTRPTAVRAVATLAHHNKDRALEVLTALLDDPENRTGIAAGEALVRIGDARSLAPLEARASKANSAIERRETERFVRELREKLGDAAPGAAGEPSARAKWYKVRDVDQWIPAEERERALTAPAAFFAAKDLVVEAKDGALWVLCWETPERAMTTQLAPWALDHAGVVDDAEGNPAVELVFDARGVPLIGALTERNMGRPLAIIADERVVRAPKIVSRLGGRAMITGDMREDVAAAIALEAATPGALAFRVAVAPGEMEEEGKLREWLRGSRK